MTEQLRLRDFPSLSQTDRNKVLTELVSHFRPSDWWQMNELFQQRSISHHFDIVAALPFELSLQIFGYLTIPELFLNRRVSRRWFEILNTQEMCRSLARKFLPNESCEFRLSEAHISAGALDWRYFWEDTASQKHFLSRGEYVKYPKLDTAVFGEYLNKWSPYAILYRDKMALYFSQGESIIRVFYLDDPTKTTEFLVPNRERLAIFGYVAKIALSDEILVIFTAIGNCHAFRLGDGGRKSIRMESGNISELLVVDYTIAVLFPESVIIWDTQTQKSWKIEISKFQHRDGMIYQLDPNRKIFRRLSPAIHEDKYIVRQEQYAYGMETGLKPEEFIIHHDSTDGVQTFTISPPSQAFVDSVYTEYMRGTGLVGKITWRVQEGFSVPCLFYDNITKRWKFERYTALPDVFSRRSDFKTQNVKVNENSALLLVGRPSGYEFAGVYLFKEKIWANWDRRDVWKTKAVSPGLQSDRYIIFNKPPLEVRRFVGIHQRKLLGKWL